MSNEIYPDLTPKIGDTEHVLLVKILEALNGIAAGGGGGPGTEQLVSYTAPGSPANPPDTSKPAMAYEVVGNGPTFGWNVALQQWK